MKQKTHWWLDLALFAAFIATFYRDFTGVEWHQWLGVLGGVLALCHLLTHWNWVSAVSQRFFNRTSNKARLFYTIDAALLIGFTLIASTGLVISTWLNLDLSNYDAWLAVHILASIGTLLLLVVKLGLHWRWLAQSARKAWSQPQVAPNRTLAERPTQQLAGANASRIGRREFLQVMGAVGAASFLSLLNASASLADLGGTISGAAADVAVQEVTPASQPGQSDSSASSSSSSCTAQCRKHCSYPGHCHRYVDSNNDNYCDLSECV